MTDIFEHLAVRPDVAFRRMCGRDGLTVSGRFFAFRDGARLVLRLPEPVVAALVAAGEALPADAVSPTMGRHWARVPAGTARPLAETYAPATRSPSDAVAGPG